MNKRVALLLVYVALLGLIPAPAVGDTPVHYEIEVDDLRDWTRVYQHSDALVLESRPEHDRDPTLVRAGGGSGEAYLLYRSKHFLRSFAVNAYFETDEGEYRHPLFYTSADGITYREVTPNVHEDGGRQAAVVYESRGFPGNSKYLKIVFRTGGAPPLIGKVVLNGPLSAGVNEPSGEVPYGRMIVLTKVSPGDTIYYTTDGTDPRTSPTRNHYHLPIPVVDSLLLKVTAVNRSGTGRSAASRVSTYQYEPSPPPPAQPPGAVETFETLQRLAGRSNIYLAHEDPSQFNNDTNRVVRATTAPGSITYRADFDITSLLMYSSFFTGVSVERHRVYASRDGRQYEEVAVQSYPVGYPVNNWQLYAYEATSLPAGTRFVKIELLGTEKAWTPQILKLILNRHTASVRLEMDVGGDTAAAVLSSATDGARIYYRLNDGPDFLPYTEPIPIRGPTMVEAYAVRDGLEPSPIRLFSVNAGEQIRLDRFGQIKAAKFAGKVTTEAELVADAAADEAYYGSLQPPSDRDRYGGLAGSREKYGLKATGFFAIQKLGNRLVMTTPEGNLYFSLAVNSVTANETFTLVKGREELFEFVPPYQGEYRFAFIGRENFSFYLLNKYRKTGKMPTEYDIYMEAIERLKKWGFNGVGAYSQEKYGEENRFPYVRMLPLAGMEWAKIDGISIFDIFAPGAEAKIDEAFRKVLPPHKDDPMLIGYFIDNEYDFHKFYSEVPKLKASKAAIKRELVRKLGEKYASIDDFNAAWRMQYRSFDQLGEAELVLKTSEAWRDMDEFFAYYLDAFFGTVSRLYRKYDPNHLLLGDRWITTAFHHDKIRTLLAEAEGKTVDVISINYYTYKLELDLLQDLHEKSGGKPLLMSEFGYGTAEQGLNPLLANSAFTQFDRGMRYRNYVEGVAVLPYVVGAHVFNYVDQAGLGRYWQGEWGERYNSGLVNVADRPYKDYLQGIMDTNYDIYKVMLGERPKFYYDFSKR